jgi:hypothetical protein
MINKNDAIVKGNLGKNKILRGRLGAKGYVLDRKIS